MGGLRRLALGLCALVLAAGCGGDLSAPTGLLSRAVTFRIEWGALSPNGRQVVIAPSQARSARLILAGAKADGADVVLDAARDTARQDAFTQSYTVPDPVRVGPTTLIAVFYAEPQPGGAALGTVQSDVEIEQDNTEIRITTVREPRSIQIAAGQSVAVGEEKLLEFAVRDASNSLVAMSAAAIFFEIAAGGDLLDVTPQGRIRGKAPGQATVTVRIPDAQLAQSAPITVTATPLNVQIAVHPGTATLPVRGAQLFEATVTGAPDTRVNWSVQEGAAGGTVDANGLYTAPDQPGTYHVVATSRADPSRSAVATVTVHVRVAVSPAAATLTLGQTQAFTATVTGAPDTGVIWSVQEGAAGGTVDASGLYTAPDEPGTYHVVAASRADPTQTATATVIVQSGSGVIIVQ